MDCLHRSFGHPTLAEIGNDVTLTKLPRVKGKIVDPGSSARHPLPFTLRKMSSVAGSAVELSRTFTFAPLLHRPVHVSHLETR